MILTTIKDIVGSRTVVKRDVFRQRRLDDRTSQKRRILGKVQFDKTTGADGIVR